MANKNVLVTVTGPSLTGKSVLASLLKPEGFEELVSTTTRPSRAGEIDGVNYNFISRIAFEKLIKEQAMIECVNVGDNYYGVTRKAFDEVIKKGKNGVVVVEPHGAQQVRTFCEKNGILLHQVFVNNTPDVLFKRFLERFKEDNKADISTYARRLNDMVNIEPNKWVKPAYDGTQRYDQLFENFGPDTQKEVISSIKYAVEEKIFKLSSNNKKYRL